MDAQLSHFTDGHRVVRRSASPDRLARAFVFGCAHGGTETVVPIPRMSRMKTLLVDRLRLRAADSAPTVKPRRGLKIGVS